MGRKKTQSTLMAFKKTYPKEICQPLNKTAGRIFPKKPEPIYIDLADHSSNYWKIICCWIAYEIHPYPDIYRPPYTQPIFKAFRSWGKVLYAQLKLCQICWENSRLTQQIYRSKNINSPWWWWEACVREFKRLQLPENSTSKSEVIRSARYILSDLKRGDTPKALDRPELQNNFALCKVAQHIQKSIKVKGKSKTHEEEEFCDFWKLFLNSFQRWIEDFRSQPLAICKVEDDGKCYYRDQRGQWQPMLLESNYSPDPKKFLVFFSPPWSDIEVYMHLRR